MQQAGASPQAIEFFRQNSGFLIRLQQMGVVAIGTVLYPSRANNNTEYLLLNGSPSLMKPTVAESGADSTYLSLLSAYPGLSHDFSPPAFQQEETIPDGGQRFVFLAELNNMCHACVVGYIRFADDFAADGRFVGAMFLEICKLSADQFPTSPVAIPICSSTG